MTKPSALAALPPEALNAIAERLYPRHFPRGTTIIQQGQTDKELYLLGEGEARVMVVDPTGREVEVGRLAEGDIFGEWSLLTNRPRAATVTAATDVEAYVLHKEDYAIVLESHLSLAQYLLSALSIRQREFAGLLTAELNLWASRYGGMKKDQMLTVSLLSVAGVPGADLADLLAPSQIALLMRSVEEIIDQGKDDGIEECLAILDGHEAKSGTGLGPALNSIVLQLSQYPTFALWRDNWIQRVRDGLTLLAERAPSAGAGEAALGPAYMATFHIVFDSTADDALVQRYVNLDGDLAEILHAAYRVHLRASTVLRAQRPGRPLDDGDLKAARRHVEQRLNALHRVAKGFPRSSRTSVSAVTWITRLLAEYFLRQDERRRRTLALPYRLD